MPPCSRALGPARVLSPWGVLGTGGGVRKRRSSACPLGASSSSSVQGQKLYHDGKLRKLQVLLHRLTKKPFSRAHAGTFLSEEFRMKPALTWARRTCALDCGAGRCGEGFMMGQEEGRRGWPGTARGPPPDCSPRGRPVWGCSLAWQPDRQHYQHLVRIHGPPTPWLAPRGGHREGSGSSIPFGVHSECPWCPCEV